MKRCSRCLLPGNYPNIRFDSEGICNFCLEYTSPLYTGEQEFLKKVVPRKDNTSPFDCLVPWSGGRDSTFVLYRMVKNYDLKVLAYNYDNGFTSIQASKNIEQIASLLNVEVIKEKMPNDLHAKYLRELVISSMDMSLEHTLFALCSICRFGIWGGAYRVAKERRIPLIVFGESRMESGYAKKVFASKIYYSTSDKVIRAIKRPLNFLKRRVYDYRFRKHFPLVHPPEGCVALNYFDYLPWEEDRMIEIIRRDLGWQHETQGDVWRFDCKIHALVNHLNYSLYGFSEKEELLSKMINEGMVTREMALSRIERSQSGLCQERKAIDEVFETLGLEGSPLEAMMRTSATLNYDAILKPRSW